MVFPSIRRLSFGCFCGCCSGYTDMDMQESNYLLQILKDHTENTREAYALVARQPSRGYTPSYTLMCNCSYQFGSHLLQFSFKEKSMMFQLKWRYDNGYKISKFWIGLFWVLVNIHHPDGVKKVLKSTRIDSSILI